MLASALIAGCGSSGGGHSYPDASVDFDAHPDQGGSTGTTDAGADASTLPTIGAGSSLIINGSVELIGSGPDTCTNQIPPSGDRWCGFSKLSSSLMDNELWVVNVSKVAAGVTVHCDPTVADPNCVRLSMGLYQDPNNGFSIHGFDGDTLVYSEEPSQSSSGFIGNVLAWRPGWTAPHNLTGNNGVFCKGHPLTNAVICVENPAPDATQTFIHTAEVHAGLVDDSGTPPPLVGTIIIQNSTEASAMSGVQKWNAALTPDGRAVAWSTRATDNGTEDLSWQSLTAGSTPIAIATDVDQWAVSKDSKKWYWLKSYNYDLNGAPSGTLQIANYPTDPGNAAPVPVTIAANVGDYTEGSNGTLYFRSHVSGNVGTLLSLPDRTMPNAVAMVDTGVETVFAVSNDGKNATYAKNFESLSSTSSLFVFDAYVAGAGTMPCALATVQSLSLAFVAPTFLAGGSLVVWGRLNGLTGSVEGVSTTIPGCVTKEFGTDLFPTGSTLTTIGDEGLVYLDSLDPDPSVNEASLRYGKLENGALPAPGTLVQARAGLEYAALPPGLDAVLYTMTTGTSADGLYLNTTLPFTLTTTPPPADGGAGGAGGDSGAGGAGGAGGTIGSDAGAVDTGASDADDATSAD